MIEVEDLELKEEVFVKSKEKTGVIIGLRQKEDLTIEVTVKFDDNSRVITTLDDLEPPRYFVTPLGILWSILYDVIGESVTLRQTQEILDEFMEKMTKSGFLRKEKEED